MITAHGRGVIAGGVEAPHFVNDRLSESEIRFLAGRVFTAMQEAGFAHIEPREDFIAGFIEGFKQFVSSTNLMCCELSTERKETR